MDSYSVLALLKEIRDEQLAQWPLARDNYEKLGETLRRSFHSGALHGAFQFNPARMVSTAAKVDATSVKKRPCFLCESNRPKEQICEEIIPGWDFLINPFPIFPLHFTIASRSHVPQDSIPMDIVAITEKLPGMTVFFNGARAGASAPDHLHLQAVPTSELPLMQFLEDSGNGEGLPFNVFYRIVKPDPEGMASLNSFFNIHGIDGITGKDDKDLVNAYCWMGKDGYLRVAAVPRSAHRPSCYPDVDVLVHSEDSDSTSIPLTGYERELMVSPGAVDIAGIVILPRKEDFESITEGDMSDIYSEVAHRFAFSE